MSNENKPSPLADMPVRMHSTKILNHGLNTTFVFDTLRIVHITAGCAEWQIGAKRYIVEGGDIVVLNNVELRKFLSSSEPDGLDIDIYEFYPSALSSKPECLNFFYNRSADYSNVIKKAEDLFPDITICIKYLKDEINSARYMRREMSACLLVQIIIMCIRATYGNSGQPVHNVRSLTTPYNAQQIAQSARYINDHLSACLTVGELARTCNMSESYYSSLFKKYIGVSVSHYINLCRIDYAVKLLESSEYKIIDIVYKCGFRTPSCFYRIFRKVKGASPKSYINIIN